MIRLILFTFFLSFLSLKTFGADDATVLLMFEESKTFGQNLTIGPKFFEQQVEVLKKMGISNLIPIYFSSEDIKEFNEETFKKRILEAIIDSDIKIARLIVATHGQVELGANETVLTEIGGFGEKGSFGHFRIIIRSLGDKFSANFHLSLMACSTFCGPEDKLRKRINALASEIMKYSPAAEVSIWGATADLSTKYKGTNESQFSVETNAKQAIKKANFLKYAFIPVSTFYFGLVDFYVLNELLPNYFRGVLTAFGFGAGLVFTTYLHKLSKTQLGFAGFLSKIKSSGEVSIEEAKYLSDHSILGNSQSRSCMDFFSK